MVQKMYDYLIKDENLYPQKSIPSGWGFLYYSINRVCETFRRHKSKKNLKYWYLGFVNFIKEKDGFDYAIATTMNVRHV